MYPNDDPMTEKQYIALHKLVHPAEWRTIDRGMTKKQASKEIGRLIHMQEIERQERWRAANPMPPIGRMRGSDTSAKQQRYTEEEMAAVLRRWESEPEKKETTEPTPSPTPAVVRTVVEQPTPAATAVEKIEEPTPTTAEPPTPSSESKGEMSKPSRTRNDLRLPSPPRPHREPSFDPPFDPPFEPPSQAQVNELYRILMPRDIQYVQFMSKREAWLVINHWHNGCFRYLPDCLKPRRSRTQERTNAVS